ncbi:hypothetical protein [Burkholderia stagnalis]|uniref:hypothetical protein n=1 Tax=Burkholderia stagnalis TaxID=1503054 RepID=UPI0007531F3F|nr:hypothetical protein [Burkholderia stagnalis]KWH32039.1 hypothetical protein WT61_15055 [Burkholderia stagnalis]KWH53231.1 hypothetical protein WT62_06990 [Burkholderia stagnalis]
MSLATLLLRWLADRLAGVAAMPHPTHPHPRGGRPLRWRAPWLAWQLLSWVALTLLAPPFCAIGALLLINPSSDQPLFWAAAMAIVPVANGAAIVAANQRHHRAPFTSRRAVAWYGFVAGATIAAALFVLALWLTHAIDALIGPLAAATAGTRPATLAPWIAGVAALFGIASSAHASIAHAWLAFDA